MKEFKIERESLMEQASRLEQETRTILPGIQALFGFQLVCVFTDRFAEALSQSHQILHWIALAFTSLATILTMAPAAFHRQAEPEVISSRLLFYADLWLTLSLIPLMLGFCIDFYLIGIVITKDDQLSLISSLVLLSLFIFMWFVLPHLSRRKLPTEPWD